MWILQKDCKKANTYANKFWEFTSYDFNKSTGLKKNIRRELKNTRSYQYLKKVRFNEYLYAEPYRLLELHNQLFTYILNIPGKEFSQDEWLNFKNNNTIHPEYAAINANELKTIKSIFNYKTQIVENKDFSYFIAGLIDSNTCTYCNRQYTLTVLGKNNESFIRPEFDHWFSQQDYPDLALSYYNLIPSCSLCNSSLKRTQKTTFQKHIHPYVDSEPGFFFRYQPLGIDKGGKDNYAVDFNITATGMDAIRVHNTLNLFRIKEIYNAHANYELRDLIELATAYPKDYIEIIITKILKDTSLTKEDIFRMLFGIEMTPKKYLDRPFSKFKNDVIYQIHEALIKEP